MCISQTYPSTLQVSYKKYTCYTYARFLHRPFVDHQPAPSILYTGSPAKGTVLVDSSLVLFVLPALDLCNGLMSIQSLQERHFQPSRWSCSSDNLESVSSNFEMASGLNKQKASHSHSHSWKMPKRESSFCLNELWTTILHQHPNSIQSIHKNQPAWGW